MRISSAGSSGEFAAEPRRSQRNRGEKQENISEAFSAFPPRPRRPCGEDPARPNPELGLTLLEMVVVTAIIGLIVAVTAPAVSAGIDSVRMTSATGSVSSFLNAALSRAERRQTAVEIVISPKENSLSAYSAEPGFHRELKLPDGIRIEALRPPVEDQSDSVRRLILMPGDTAPGIGIQLANQHGSHRLVRLDPMTGFPHVESVQAE
jgi:type II secretory pathway pseudopilin PulG